MRFLNSILILRALSCVKLSWQKQELLDILAIREADLVMLFAFLASWGVEMVCDRDTCIFPYPMYALTKGVVAPHADLHEKDMFFWQAVASTNDPMYGLHDPENAKIVFSDYQLHGRGQYQRTWDAPYASNVLLSVHKTFKDSIDWAGFSQVVGYLLSQGLQKLYPDLAFSTKDPNDILISGRKVAGVLIEAKTLGACQYAVIGVGLNVNMPIGQEVGKTRTSLATELGHHQDRLKPALVALQSALTSLEILGSL